ncbi:MAG: branched-chain-amino-acid transaminase [bacterium]|nr:branched-chain-amino-acid transaminase [bacterium]
MGLIYIDGKLYKKEEAKISVFDHGLLYGDGVFEGIRVYNGRVFKLSEHLDRLFSSAKYIMLNIPLTKEELTKAVIETTKANELKEAYIRLIVTRGIGDLGLDPKKCPNPSIIIIADKIELYPKEYYENGLELITVPTRKNSQDALSPCIKTLNYLNSIMAKIEANQAGVLEAIMLNAQGYVAECSGDNIFVVKNNSLLTPPLWVGALEGITRDTVMKIGKELGFEVKEAVMTRFDLYTADECFLTGTAAEVIPVKKIDNRIIGNGKSGKLTLKITTRFHELTQTEGTNLN